MKVEDLAKVYQNMLGAHYDIDVNCNLNLNGGAIQGIMFVAHRPFAVTGLKAETLELNFEFYVDATIKEKKLDVMEELKQILGTKEGKFISEDIEYTYSSFLEFCRPTSAPLADEGRYRQVIFIHGSCFVSPVNGGVKMSNDIKTYLTFNGIRGRVYPKIVNINNVRDVDAPTKANENENAAQVKTQGVSRSLTLYDLRDDICTELEKYIEVTDEFGDPNKLIEIERVYPGFTVKKKCVITSGIIQEVPGAFLCLEIGLQKQATCLETPQVVKAKVNIDTMFITVTNITGEYQRNADGTITCDLGAVISVELTGSKRYLYVEGGTSKSTGDPFIVSPKTYDVTITQTTATISYKTVDDNTQII